MNKFYTLIKYLIGWPLSFVALIFILKLIFTNANNSIFKIREINFYLLFLSITCFIIYFFLRGFLWKYILGEKGKQFSFKKTLLNWSTSELKRYVPGSIWSFMSRTTTFETKELSKKDIIIYIAHEAIILCLSSLIISLFYIFKLSNNIILNYSVLLFTFFATLIFISGSKLLKVFSNEKLTGKLVKLFFLDNSYFVNFKILLLGLVTFFLFGLGTYFSLVSIFYIDLKYILVLISLFTFSFFIGYISLITPMGLGVREGITTFGLLPFLSNPLAALVSLFSRIIFIVSELISLLIIILWNKLNYNLIKKIENFISKYRFEILLVGFVSIYIIYFFTASFFRYDNFYTGRFDLGNMDQTVWNTIHGRIFQLTDPDGTQTISRLSVHADFILILISPLYLIWSNPKMLLLLQTLVLAFGAFFVYLISKQILKNKNISLTFAICYLLNPALQYTNLYDFHPVTLATTFLLITFYFYLRKKYIWFLIFAILAALTKEELWTIVGVFGLFIAFRTYLENKTTGKWKSIILGLILFVFGVLTTFILVSKIIPYVKGSDHFALSYYSDFGNSTSGIIKNIIFNPIKTISTITEKSRLYFLFQIFSPLGFLSILSPITLIFALPDLLIDLLSNNAQLHEIYYQYTAAITPFIFISSVFSVKFIVRKFKMINYQILAVYIILSTLIAVYITGPLPGSQKPNIDMFSKQLVNSNIISRFISRIPKKYSIAATNNLGSHLSRRQNIYNIPLGLDRADVIVFLIDHGFSSQSITEQMQMINKLKNDPSYSLMLVNKDFFAFKKTGLPLFRM